MKKIITALMASTMLMGATLPAAAAINPFNIDESSSAANIYKAIDKSGDASGVIGGFAWVKIGDEVYSMAIRELAKAGSAKKAKELFESYIAEEMMAERIALAKSNFEAAKEAVIAALATKPSGPGFFELAQAKLAYLSTEIEYLEGMAQPEDFDYAPVVERLSDEQAAYFTALRKYVAGYVANVVAEDIDVTKHTAQHTSSVVVELSNGNFATVSFDDADKVTADSIDARHADSTFAHSVETVALSNGKTATVSFHDAADVDFVDGFAFHDGSVDSRGDVSLTRANGTPYYDVTDETGVQDAYLYVPLNNGKQIVVWYDDASDVAGARDLGYGMIDGEAGHWVGITLTNGHTFDINVEDVFQGGVDSVEISYDIAGDFRGTSVSESGVLRAGDALSINVSGDLQTAHEDGRGEFRQELNDAGTGIVVSGVYNPTVVYRTTAVDPQFGVTLTTGEYDSVNDVFDAGHTAGHTAGFAAGEMSVTVDPASVTISAGGEISGNTATASNGASALISVDASAYATQVRADGYNAGEAAGYADGRNAAGQTILNDTAGSHFSPNTTFITLEDQISSGIWSLSDLVTAIDNTAYASEQAAFDAGVASVDITTDNIVFTYDAIADAIDQYGFDADGDSASFANEQEAYTQGFADGRAS